MKFEINDNIWKIKEVPKELIQGEDALAETDYMEQEIRILDTCKCKVNSLKHELCHVWLWEYGHIQNDDYKYPFEQVCQIVANSNDFINDIIEDYF